MARAPIPAEAREIPFEAFDRRPSDTAANANRRIFPKSGAMDYRVTVGQSGGGMNACVVNAETGDDAADKALRQFPGWKVINVTPATDAGLITGGVEALDAA